MIRHFLPKMEHVKDTIGIDADSSADRWWVGPVADRMGQLSNGWRRHLLLLILIVDSRVPAALASNTRLNVDAGLSGIAGFTRILGMGLVGSGGGGGGGSLIERSIGVGPLSLSLRMGFGLRSCSIAFFSRGIAR